MMDLKGVSHKNVTILKKGNNFHKGLRLPDEETVLPALTTTQVYAPSCVALSTLANASSFVKLSNKEIR